MINHWFIVSQILGLITICFEFTSYQIKDKTKGVSFEGSFNHCAFF